MRNNRDIRGIVLNGIEYKLSQYGDGASLIFFMVHVYGWYLRVKYHFADLSGLKKLISQILKWFGLEIRHFQEMYFTSQDGN